MLLVWGRGLIGSDKTESAVPGRCELKNSSLILKVSKEVINTNQKFFTKQQRALVNNYMNPAYC